MPNEQDGLFEFEPYSGISDADLEDVYAKVDFLVDTLSTEIDIPDIPASAQAPAVIPKIEIPPASLPHRAATTGPLSQVNVSTARRNSAQASTVQKDRGKTSSLAGDPKQRRSSSQTPSANQGLTGQGERAVGRQVKRAKEKEASVSVSRIPERFIEEDEARQRARQRLAARLRAREEREAAQARERLVQEATAAAKKHHQSEASGQEASDANQRPASENDQTVAININAGSSSSSSVRESASETPSAGSPVNGANATMQNSASPVEQGKGAVSQASEASKRPKVSRAQVIAAAVPEVVAEGEPLVAAFGPRIPRVSETAVTAEIPVVSSDGTVKGSEVSPDATAEMDPIFANPSRMAVASRSKRRITKGKVVGIILAIMAAALILFGSFFVWNRWYRYDDAADMQGEWQVANSSRTLVFTDSVMKISEDVDYEYTIDTSKKVITYTFGDAVGTASYRFSADRKTLIIDEDNTGTDWLMALGFKSDEVMKGSDVPDGITKLQKRSDNTEAEPQNLTTASSDGEDDTSTSSVPGYTEYSKPSLTNDKSKESSDGQSDDGTDDEEDEDDDYVYKDEETGTKYYYDSVQVLYYDQYGNYYYDMYGNNPYTVTTYSYEGGY